MAPKAPAAPAAPVARGYEAACVKIRVLQWGGSGTVVAVNDIIWPNGRQGPAGMVLTCRHVGTEKDPNNVKITFPDGRTIAAFHLAVDPNGADLAAVYFDARDMGAVPSTSVATVAPQRGQQVLQAGWPSIGGNQVFNRRAGSVIGYQGATVKGVPVYDLQMSVQNGDSGSGAFNTGGELIAVIWGGDGRSTATTGLPEIWRFLDERCCKLFPSLRKPQQPPVQPPVVPPVTPQPPPPSVDLAPLLSRLEALQKAQDELRQAIGGVKNGIDGKDGKDGANGKDATSPDLAALLAKINALEVNISNVLKLQAEPLQFRLVPRTQPK